jgi:DNA-binding CsgD family transcriptional regulator
MSLAELKILTDREKEIVQYLIEGHSTKDIADKLSIKSNTVSTIKKNAFSKLKVSNIVEAYKLMVK